jgi:diacylglycerol kinase family enzyme
LARRVAAVIALLAPVAALAVALSAMVSSLGWALLTALCVLVAVGSAWLLLTRRGTVRVLGWVGLLAAVSALVVFQILHWRSLLVFLLLIGLLAVFGVAGRFAIGSDPRPMRPTPVSRPVGPAQHGVLIVNPRSGGGKATRFDLPGEAARRGIQVLILEPGTDLRELAQRSIAQGADVIGMAGGDGSQAIVADVARRHDIPHVCVPSGTRNHFALDLGLDRDDVVGALDAFTNGIERRIDLARINEHVFVNNASLGVYAQVVRSDSYREAKLQTWARLLPDILGPDAEPSDLRFEGPDGTRYTDAALILVSNNPYQVAPLAGAGTRPRLDTGLLGVLVARIRSAADVSELAALEATGQPQRYSGLIGWTGREFQVTSTAAIPIGLDGEALTIDPPARFTSLPGALRIRLPRHASGVSPAAAAITLNRDDFWALVRVAFGAPRGTPPPRSGSHP